MIRPLCVIVLIACGGRSSAPAHPEAQRDGAPSPRSDEQCDKLLAHTFELAVAERPANQKLTADERTNIQTQLRKTWLPSCRQMSSAGYDCALAAHSLAEIDTCSGNAK